MVISAQYLGQLKKIAPTASLAGGIRRAEASYDFGEALADLGVEEERSRSGYLLGQKQLGREQRLETKKFGADYSNRGLAESGAYQQDLSTLIEAQAAQAAEQTRQYEYSLQDVERARRKASSLFSKEFALAGMEDVASTEAAQAQQDFYNILATQRGIGTLGMPSSPSSSRASGSASVNLGKSRVGGSFYAGTKTSPKKTPWYQQGVM